MQQRRTTSFSSLWTTTGPSTTVPRSTTSTSTSTSTSSFYEPFPIGTLTRLDQYYNPDLMEWICTDLSYTIYNSFERIVGGYKTQPLPDFPTDFDGNYIYLIGEIVSPVQEDLFEMVLTYDKKKKYTYTIRPLTPMGVKVNGTIHRSNVVLEDGDIIDIGFRFSYLV